MMGLLIFLLILLFIFIIAGLRVIQQYEIGIKLRLGKYVGKVHPGLRWIIPVIDRLIRVDMRVVTIDIPSQEVMSLDNVPLRVNGVVFFRVVEPDKAVLNVENYKYAISQLAQSALRDVCGKADLDTILSRREAIGNEIERIVDKETDRWGIDITDVKLTDIVLPDSLKRAMAHQAEAERDKRARIILSEGELQAAKKLYEAGKIIGSSQAALKLRLYQTLSEIAAEKNSTIILPFPEEMLKSKNK